MAIDFIATTQKPPVTITSSNDIRNSHVRGAIQAVNARYKYSRRMFFSEFRDSVTLDGPNSPWYTASVAEEPEWKMRVCRLPFRLSNPLPGYNDTIWSGVSGLPYIGVHVTGQNIQFLARVVTVDWNTTTGGLTSTGTIAVLNSALNTLAFDSVNVDLSLPPLAESGGFAVLEFFYRGNNANSEDPGYLRDLVFYDTGPSDFPAGSY